MSNRDACFNFSSLIFNLGQVYAKDITGNEFDPKCFDDKGNMKSEILAMQGSGIDHNAKHGLVYDMKTDKFVPIEK